MLLNIRDRGKEIGEDIIDRNLPGRPQYDWCDFLMSLRILPTSKGLVLISFKLDRTSVLSSFGGVSELLSTVAFWAKWLFKMSLFSFGSVIVLSFSIKGGIEFDLN